MYPASWLFAHLAPSEIEESRVLELGCGNGRDAAALAASGGRLVASDIRRDRALTTARQAPEVDVLQLSHALPLPFRNASFDVAVASLTLHYMPWAQTLATFREIRRVLRPAGTFVFRVNSHDDIVHGAGKGEEVEPGFFVVPERTPPTKRFFDEEMVRDGVSGLFAVRSLTHKTIDWRGRPKRVWECRAEATRD